MARKGRVKTEWHGDKVERQVADQMEINMRAAMAFLQGETRKLLNRGQPTRRTKSGRVVGLNPSAPGTPPKRLTGRLLQSVATRVTVTATSITGAWGTSLPYARRHELGFTGTDAAGRNYRIPPRPFLWPALANNVRDVARILGR